MKPPWPVALRVVLACPNHRKATIETAKEALAESSHRAGLSHEMGFIERVAKLARHRKHDQCAEPFHLLEQALD
ncbi:MAG TPA: hypothetical protein VMF50_03880 [Candidatus Binataceae bacterium]|nr:hypothetical protein [Candidatus Binataceae bacterium]